MLCPLDPKHSCYADKIDKHLKKCNSRKELYPVYYQENLNSGYSPLNPNEYRKTIRDIELPELIGLIERINFYYEKYYQTDTLNEYLCHDSVEKDISDPKTGKSAVKHLKQQGSIIEHINRLELLQDDTCFIEFGAGKGGLSHILEKASKELNSVQFILIERGAVRYKKDNYHKEENQGPIFERLRVDIEHLALDKVESLKNPKKKVAIGKHLCGSATDMMLRCLMENWLSGTGNQFRGLVLALCCHHRCDWKSYVGKKFFEEAGFSARDFHLISTLSSWYTCGTKDIEIKEGKLTLEERSQIGKRCKLLIDFGRKQYLKSFNLDSQLVAYVDPDISLENILLKAKFLK
ncbi:DgyrCDS1091 [Dimorphilus gyrociliatus]|nr:DgyrCDS1091 [Dimorphilus gyrociliatus]